MQEGKCTGDEQKQVTERAGRAGGGRERHGEGSPIPKGLATR